MAKTHPDMWEALGGKDWKPRKKKKEIKYGCPHCLSQENLSRKRRLERYNDYKDDLRTLAKKYRFEMPVAGWSIYFYFPMPKSWSAKKKSLFDSSKQKPASATSTMTVENPFLRAGLKEQSKVTTHGAVKYTTTGSDFVDQFARVTDYKAPRSYAAISADMEKLWNQNKLLTLCLVFYIRMITRVVQFFNGSKTETTQRGQGLKHEGIFRMMWIAINASDTFWKNISLFISVGSWKDIVTMLSYDLQFNGWKDRVLDWNKFGLLLLAGLENTNTSAKN